MRTAKHATLVTPGRKPGMVHKCLLCDTATHQADKICCVCRVRERAESLDKRD